MMNQLEDRGDYYLTSTRGDLSQDPKDAMPFRKKSIEMKARRTARAKLLAQGIMPRVHSEAAYR